jgi:hypothetical protein
VVCYPFTITSVRVLTFGVVTPSSSRWQPEKRAESRTQWSIVTILGVHVNDSLVPGLCADG